MAEQQGEVKKRIATVVRIGQKLGKLTVTRVGGYNKHGDRYAGAWCECGNPWEGFVSEIARSDGVRSCGCSRIHRLDILGVKHGFLTITQVHQGNHARHRTVSAVCDCGEPWGGQLTDIKDERITTCGKHGGRHSHHHHVHSNPKIPGGELLHSYGRLMILDVIQKAESVLDPNGDLVLCSCICGGLHVGHIVPIRKGKIMSCGCYRPQDKPPKEHAKMRDEIASQRVWGSYPVPTLKSASAESILEFIEAH